MLTEAEPRKTIVQEINQALIAEVEACSALDATREPTDVLFANQFFGQLPTLVKGKDIGALRDITEILGERAATIPLSALSTEQVKKAQRDLSPWVTVTTLLSKNTDNPPIAEKIVPIGAEQLLRLSREIDYQPRTTELNWAKKSNRRLIRDTQVTFGDGKVKAEAIIKVCAGKTWEKQEDMVTQVVGLTEVDVNSPEFVHLTRQSVKDFSAMVSGVIVLRRFLTDTQEGKQFFNNEFLQDSMPIQIGGKDEKQSGSKIPAIQLLDEAAGVTSSLNPGDVLYRGDNLTTLPNQQEQFERARANLENLGTLTDRVLASSNIEAIQGFYDLLAVIAQFRIVHTKGLDKTIHDRAREETSAGSSAMAYDLRDRSVAVRDRVKEHLDKAA